MCHGSKNLRGKKIKSTEYKKQKKKQPYNRTNKHKQDYVSSTTV